MRDSADNRAHPGRRADAKLRGRHSRRGRRGRHGFQLNDGAEHTRLLRQYYENPNQEFSGREWTTVLTCLRKKASTTSVTIEAAFNKIQSPDVYHFSCIMKYYVDKGDEKKAEGILDRMAAAKPRPVHADTHTWNTLLKLYVDKGDEKKAEGILDRMAAAKPRPVHADTQTWSTLMVLYMKRGDTVRARELYNRLKDSHQLDNTTACCYVRTFLRPGTLHTTGTFWSELLCVRNSGTKEFASDIFHAWLLGLARERPDNIPTFLSLLRRVTGKQLSTRTWCFAVERVVISTKSSDVCTLAELLERMELASVSPTVRWLHRLQKLAKKKKKSKVADFAHDWAAAVLRSHKKDVKSSSFPLWIQQARRSKEPFVLGKGGQKHVVAVRRGQNVVAELRPLKSQDDGMENLGYLREEINQEINLLQSLKEQGCGRVLRVLSESGQPAGVELCDLGDLASLIFQEGSKRAVEPDLGILLSLCIQMAGGVEELHGHGVVHGDLKPDNVLLCSTNSGIKAVLSDFGFAKKCDDLKNGNGEGEEYDGGTCLYNSPEKMRGDHLGEDGRFGKTSDVWALGCVLLECASGERVFKGLSQSEIENWVGEGDEGESDECNLGEGRRNQWPCPLHFSEPNQLLESKYGLLNNFESGWGALPLDDHIQKLCAKASRKFRAILENGCFIFEEDDIGFVTASKRWESKQVVEELGDIRELWTEATDDLDPFRFVRKRLEGVQFTADDKKIADTDILENL